MKVNGFHKCVHNKVILLWIKDLQDCLDCLAIMCALDELDIGL